MGKKKKRDRSRSNEREIEKKRKRKKEKSKKKKRHRSPSTSSASSSEDRKKRKRPDKAKLSQIQPEPVEDNEPAVGPEIPPELIGKPAVVERPKMAPMTKAEWDKKQTIIRRVYDEASGRTRLIRGDGEILEEIVTKDRHKEINKQATAGDGAFFQSKLPKR